MKTTLFDYGAGNLHSLAKALELAGAVVTIESDPMRALDTELVVLPGVGAFGAAAARLAPARDAWRARLAGGLPCLGVCLGMQLLYESSEESEGRGLGMLEGAVTRLAARRVPHMGWNTIEDAEEPAFHDARLETAYFAHGYACRPARPDDCVAWCRHENDRFPAAVKRGVIVGVQFHPEKSSSPGIAFLAALLRRFALERAAASEPIELASPPCTMDERDARGVRP